MGKSRHISGFTMIELVLVITILGVIAAFAVPRFADLRSSARDAALDGMVGGMRSAAALAHSVSLTQGLAASDPIQFFGNSAFIVYATGTPGRTSCGFAFVRAFPPAFPLPRYLGPNTTNCR